MNKFKVFIIFLFTAVAIHANACTFEEEKLVTTHGILGAPWNMYYLSGEVQRPEMTLHWGYPSTEKKILQHGEDLALYLLEVAIENPGKPIHFLTHSMGGLVLRAALNHPCCPIEAHIGKAVLLAPPNQGSAWGRMLNRVSLANYLGRENSGEELMTTMDFEHLGPFPDTMKVMVIAGNFSYNPLINDENDGTVGVTETYLKTPHKHVVIKVGHKSILVNKQAACLTYNFFHDIEDD